MSGRKKTDRRHIGVSPVVGERRLSPHEGLALHVPRLSHHIGMSPPLSFPSCPSLSFSSALKYFQIVHPGSTFDVEYLRVFRILQVSLPFFVFFFCASGLFFYPAFLFGILLLMFDTLDVQTNARSHYRGPLQRFAAPIHL